MKTRTRLSASRRRVREAAGPPPFKAGQMWGDGILDVEDDDPDWLKHANPEAAEREIRVGRMVTDDFREKAGLPRLYGPQGEELQPDDMPGLGEKLTPGILRKLKGRKR